MKASAGNQLIKNDIRTIINNLEGNKFQGKNVLVTGGAGFLGSWVCEVLINLGAKVICVDNLSSGLESNITGLADNSNFKFYVHDISEPFDPGEKIDFVFHMASRASPFEFEKFPLEILKSNTLGTLNSLEIARRNNARFLFTSTSETYGNPSIVPTPESYYGYVNAIGIRGCYDESKRCGEAYAFAFNKQYNLDIRIARIFNTYGPRMRADGIYGRVAPRFIEQALNDKPITVFGTGEQTRSFCYVTDQVEGLLKLITNDKAIGSVVNIGNNHEITVLELANLVKRLINTSTEITFSPLPEDDPLKRCPDITKAELILGWKPKVKLEDGLRKIIEWLSESI